MDRKRCSCGTLAVLRKGANHKLASEICAQISARGVSTGQPVDTTLRLLTQDDYAGSPTRILVDATIAAVLALAEREGSPQNVQVTQPQGASNES